MTLNEFKAWLDERISILGPELERLLNARNAIERAEAELGADALTDALPLRFAQTRVSPGTYVAKVKRVTKSGKTIEVNFNPEEWRRVLDEVPKIVADGPMKSGEIINALYPDPNNRSKKARDRGYAAIGQLKAKGILIKRDDGLWELATAAVKEQANG